MRFCTDHSTNQSIVQVGARMTEAPGKCRPLRKLERIVMSTDILKVEKLQHPIKVRTLTVKRTTDLSPSMRRITLTGDDLAGFVSASFDDHLKLMVPDAPGASPNV